jgi:signal transduction histidine kinase
MNELTSLDQLDNLYPGIVNRLNELEPGENKKIDLVIQGNTTPFLFRTTEFLLGNENIRLVAFQSIRSELEENEMVSWEKLIRVLSHEVSNSVTPITTLGSNIKKRLSAIMSGDKKQYPLEKELAGDLHRSAELIEQRGNSLVDFIQQYKTLMRLPEPELNPTRLKSLLEDISSLCGNLDVPAGYEIITRVTPANLTCNIDHKQIEQALINLIKNAIEAIPEDRKGRIEISAAETDRLVEIKIQDNGRGIPKDILDQIFIPFFTTRDKGSGIGLSLSRRIIQHHGGSITLNSEVDKGTTVFIELPMV